MSKLILSDECFNIDHDFFSDKRNLYTFNDYITDGIFLIDTMKMNCVKEHNIIDVPITKINHLTKLISKENLKKVLKIENEVSFSNISLYNYTLATTGKKCTLINSIYYNFIKSFEVFFYEDFFYFFELCEAIESMGIDFDSYMFLGIVAGIKIDSRKGLFQKHSTIEIINQLKDLQKYHKEQNNDE